MNIIKFSKIYILFFVPLLSLKSYADCPISTDINILADGSHSALTQNGSWSQPLERNAYRSNIGETNSFNLKFVYAFRTELKANRSISAKKIICSYRSINKKIMSLESLDGQEFYISSSVDFSTDYNSPGWKSLEIGATCFALNGSCIFTKVN
ncbi:hypothetical protein [Fluviispira sanaruensis]|uniref:Uncharacterized protein n=1 Tax=Fluviispira sanaruensis TaxID=2493639 RepID=A0A4P2VM28_FLUSA|nr:hypothetical protein [Fluviispira sanaruensis]BBH52890.1 hypothetical protein JCM31447_13330 [Fluviispira sanaruensis]